MSRFIRTGIAVVVALAATLGGRAGLAAPSDVRVYCGWIARWSVANRTIERTAVQAGAGFLLRPDGYVLTNAHLVASMMDTQRRLESLASLDVLRRLLEEGNRQTGEADVAELVGQIRRGRAPEPRLVDFRRIRFVVLADGQRVSFQVKAFGVPFGGSSADVLTGNDIALLKVDLSGTTAFQPAARLGPQPGETVSFASFPEMSVADVLSGRAGMEPRPVQGSVAANLMAQDGMPVFRAALVSTRSDSGAALLDAAGKVVGLLTYPGDTLDGRASAAPPFIVPVDTAQQLLRRAGVEWATAGAASAWAPAPGLAPAGQDVGQTIATGVPAWAWADSGLFGQPVWVVIAAGAGAVLLTIILVLVVRSRRKTRAQPLAAGPPTPSVGASVSAPPAVVVAAPAPGIPRTRLLEAAATARLTCTVGPILGRDIPIGPGLHIGRDPARAQIVVEDSQVSGQHVWVGPVAEHVVLRDCGSTNGTFLNHRTDQRITEVPLCEGDVVLLGPRGTVQFVFHA